MFADRPLYPVDRPPRAGARPIAAAATTISRWPTATSACAATSTRPRATSCTGRTSTASTRRRRSPTARPPFGFARNHQVMLNVADGKRVLSGPSRATSDRSTWDRVLTRTVRWRSPAGRNVEVTARRLPRTPGDRGDRAVLASPMAGRAPPHRVGDQRAGAQRGAVRDRAPVARGRHADRPPWSRPAAGCRRPADAHDAPRDRRRGDHRSDGGRPGTHDHVDRRRGGVMVAVEADPRRRHPHPHQAARVLHLARPSGGGARRAGAGRDRRGARRGHRGARRRAARGPRPVLEHL